MKRDIIVSNKELKFWNLDSDGSVKFQIDMLVTCRFECQWRFSDVSVWVSEPSFRRFSVSEIRVWMSVTRQWNLSLNVSDVSIWTLIHVSLTRHQHVNLKVDSCVSDTQIVVSDVSQTQCRGTGRCCHVGESIQTDGSGGVESTSL